MRCRPSAVAVDPGIAEQTDHQQRQQHIRKRRARHRAQWAHDHSRLERRRPARSLQRAHAHGAATAAGRDTNASTISASQSGSAADATKCPRKPTVAATRPSQAILLAAAAPRLSRSESPGAGRRRVRRAAARWGTCRVDDRTTTVTDATTRLMRTSSLRTEPPTTPVAWVEAISPEGRFRAGPHRAARSLSIT
jgi:hypothetical protein